MGTTKAVLAVVFAVTILGAPLICCALANVNDNSDSYELQPKAREELIAFVNEAKDFVLAEGKDKALHAISDPRGTFVRGELYLIAFDFNGTCLAYPYAHEKIGKNWLNAMDPNDVALGRNMRDVAKRGGGFTYYIWPNPTHSNTEELKLAYVVKVDEGLWLASGMYLPGPAPIFSETGRKNLVAFVESARDFALNHTKKEALKALNNKNGEFIRGNRYIFADDFEGTALAMPFEPGTVGINHIDVQDPNGVFLIQELLDVAKRGSGFTYVVYKDPADNMTYRLKLRYVMKVNDEWFLGSGVYWPEA